MRSAFLSLVAFCRVNSINAPTTLAEALPIVQSRYTKDQAHLDAARLAEDATIT